MNKPTYITALCCLAALLLFHSASQAQTLSPQSMAGSGGAGASSTGALSWTLGAFATTTCQTTGNALTQGFQQPEILLSTGTIISQICAGSTVDVPYIVSGVFSSINIFTVELSDASGGFSSPVVIGTGTGWQSGTITAHIPPSTPFGTNYRIRLLSSLPTCTGTDNGSDIVIQPPPPVAISVSPSPTNPAGDPNTIYLGYGPQSVVLTASTASSYSWSSVPGGFMSSVQAPAVSPTVTTTYSVTIANSLGCSSTASVTIYVVDLRCGNNNNNVTICHNNKTKCVASSAVAAHLAHGDYLGGCQTPKAGVVETATNSQFMLHQNFPNPFAGGTGSSSTTISYTVPEESNVAIRVYDVYGRLVQTLVDDVKHAGFHSVNFNSGKLPGGVYFYALEAENTVLTRRMVLLN
jgi:type IX secretion system substrate protein